MFPFSLVIKAGLSSTTSIAAIAALARYGGKEAENTYPELLNRCKRLEKPALAFSIGERNSHYNSTSSYK